MADLGDQVSPLVRVAVTTLRMDPLTDAQLDEYLASGQWEGKAGAFGYQDRLGWVHIVEGSESNVVGLPMELLAEMLAEIAKLTEANATERHDVEFALPFTLKRDSCRTIAHVACPRIRKPRKLAL